MAVVLSMIASTVPWGPVVAFMVSSPLMSPSEYFYAAGVMGWKFATALLLASIAIGLGAGCLADLLERRGYLQNQTRLAVDRAREAAAPAATAFPAADPACCGPEGSRSCCAPAMDPRRPGQAIGCTFAEPDTVPEDANLGLGCGCFAGRGVSPSEAKKEGKSRRLAELARRMRLREMAGAGLPLGLRILAFFFAFSYLGHLINLALPTRWVMDLFGAGRFHAVPLAAALGVPLYLNAEVSMPAVKSFVEMGMSPGAALALIITGAGTSVGAIAGALVIAKKRIVGLVVASLLFGAVLAGYVYDLVLATA